MKPLSQQQRHIALTRLAFFSGAMFIATAPALFAAEFQLNRHTFTLPEGFIVETIAEPPLIERPITAAFDEQGRLYVADSSGSNEPVKQQLETKPHRIVRLEDTDGDGSFDAQTVFADRMMFPEGTLWHEGSLYVTAPPSIWKLTDTDDDGVADQREEWFDAKSLTGCANDLHGPYAGPDGWIYWCKGAFAEQTYARPDGRSWTTRAAHIFRRRPEGGWVEPVMTGGMDNPVDVAFSRTGERFFTTTFLQHPGGGKRDGIIHAIYGGVYGKPHGVLDGHPRTGDLMPVMTHLGPSAPCGLTRYRSRVFGPAYRDNLFACSFNLHKVTRHIPQPSGATFVTVDEDFLISDQVDFHPTDVLEDADGSLVVVDTGGWYKICCPTSQLYKPDVLGAIYRVRRVDARPLEDPRGLEQDWAAPTAEALAARLGDARPAVRERASQALRRLGSDSLPALRRVLGSSGPAEADLRRRALWTLMAVEDEAARELNRSALADDDAEVCQVAAYGAGLWRDIGAAEALRDCLKRPQASLRRAAAEALGRIGDVRSVPELLRASGEAGDDRVLEHSLIYALIEIGDAESTRHGLALGHERAQRAALMALDQMAEPGLRAEDLAPLLASDRKILKETGAWLIQRHPEWAGDLVAILQEQFKAPDLPDNERQALERQLAAFAGNDSVQTFLASELHDPNVPAWRRRSVLRVMKQSGLKEMPHVWARALSQVFRDEQSRAPNVLLVPALETASAWSQARQNPDTYLQALRRVAEDAAVPEPVRLRAMDALGRAMHAVDDPTLGLLLRHALPENEVETRRRACAVLAQAPLSSDQLVALARSLERWGPLEIPTVLAAFERQADAAAGQALLQALRETGPRLGLRAEILRPTLEALPASLRHSAEALLSSLSVVPEEQQTRLETMLGELDQGDPRRGQEVFNSTQAACRSCHAIGYLGGDLGPDLTRIGQVRTRRDLLEAIVYPSASFVRSYEPLWVETRDGESHSGILKSEDATGIVLATGVGVTIRLAREEILSMQPGQISVMPGGLDQQLSPQELADLLAFLQATRW